MKDVQCYELFGGIAPKNHAFSFNIFKLVLTPIGSLDHINQRERREAEFLRQRLSHATVRGNAQSVAQASCPSS